MFFRYFTLLSFVAYMSLSFATDAPTPDSKTPPPAPSAFALSDEHIVKNKSIVVQNEKVTYDIHCGALTIKDKEEKNTANIYFTAYFATTTQTKPRPIAFCFNGGPGSSSIWLHMGCLGPKIVTFSDETFLPSKDGYKDNPTSLLAVCDLVFIDPVSTGFSRASPGSDESKFCGVENDLYSCAEFIRSFLTKFRRWNSPKFLIGESYGTTRAAGLARLLQSSYFIDVDGLILISLVLDFRYVHEFPANDMKTICSLPTYAATAAYHKKLQPPYSNMNVSDLVSSVSSFATFEYAPAMLAGSSLPTKAQEDMANRLSTITSLPPSLFLNNNLNVSPSLFSDEVLKEKGLEIGIYDTRMTTWDTQGIPSFFSSGGLDHSLFFISSAFTSAFNDYMSRELNWEKDSPYICLNRETNRSWNWSFGYSQEPGQGYFSLIQDLRLCVKNNPRLKIFVAAGYYDLSCPYLGQKYSVDHLFLPENRKNDVIFKGYEAGHMMYLHEPSRKALFSDLTSFIDNKKP